MDKVDNNNVQPLKIQKMAFQFEIFQKNINIITIWKYSIIEIKFSMAYYEN